MKYILLLVCIVAISCTLDFRSMKNPVLKALAPVIKNWCVEDRNLCKYFLVSNENSEDVVLQFPWVPVIVTAVPIIWDVAKKVFKL